MLDRPWVPAVAIVGFLGLTTAIAFSWNAGPDHGFLQILPLWLQIVVSYGSYLLLGFAIGRWWALGVACLPILIATFAGTDEDGMRISTIFLIDTVVFFGPLTFIGIVLRTFVAARHAPRTRRSARRHP